MQNYQKQFRDMLQRRRAAEQADPQTVADRQERLQQLGSQRMMDVQVAGAYYKLNDDLRASLAEGAPLVWRREPQNSHDSNAIALALPGTPERMIGYVPSRVAARLAPHLDQGRQLSVEIIATPLGMQDSTVTVRLCLDMSEPSQEQMAAA